MQDKPKIKAQLREVREGAGRIWWESYVKSHSEDINRRFGLARAVYWTQAERMPLDLFSYIREAGLCFGVARFLATIVFSSTAVELVLNRDQRTRRNRELRRIGGWATLNNANLIIAAREGLPVHLLLSKGESLTDHEPVRFVERRNKVAHGEISDMVKNITDYDPKAEVEAFDQLDKGDRFIVEWFNTEPDVQESHIQNYRWPE
jgi:hypothetical protein